MKRIHVDENVTIRTDEEADAAFLKENDFDFYEKGKGVVKITKERWEKAQRTERRHWMELGIKSSDDRNFYHAEKFDNYRLLSGLNFKHALEVGCGPFTNLRLIGQYCKIEKCSLNDPLIEDYLGHTNCSYSKSSLKMHNSKKGFFRGLFTKQLPVEKLYASAFEEIKTEQKFDMLVIINVIEHCFDFELFLDKINSLLAADGLLIFEDKLYDQETLEEDINTVYDAAHPLRVNRNLLVNFLNNNFTKLYCEIKANTAELAGKNFKWDDIYFIGKK